MKVDICMWTKNSATMIPSVLQRIDEVIPAKFVGKKIVSDDHSEDNTVGIAKGFGWTVYVNRGRGIGANIRTALSHVTSDFFVSVEHDVILSRQWWKKISAYMTDKTVAVAQGVRVATHPILRKLDEYAVERMIVRSLDNNIYRTQIIREIIRELDVNLAFFETEARRKIEEKGMKWVVDKSVISLHIRDGVVPFMEHIYKLHLLSKGRNRRRNFRIFATSPFRALHIAFKKNCPYMMIIYPLFRAVVLRASLERG